MKPTRTANPNEDLLDRLLDEHLAGPAEQLEPSSGFALSVMEAIAAQTATPPPIAFPWRRALPALAAVLLGLLAVAGMMLRGGHADAGSTVAPSQSPSALTLLHGLVGFLQNASADARFFSSGEGTACWVIVAACLSVTAIAASFRLTRSS